MEKIFFLLRAPISKEFFSANNLNFFLEFEHKMAMFIDKNDFIVHILFELNSFEYFS